MPAEEEPMEESEPQWSEFVPAVIARTTEEAESFRELLNDHAIPAVLSPREDGQEGDVEEPLGRGGVAVLVPEELLDEASRVIAEREEMDEFAIIIDEGEDLEDDQEDLELEEGQGQELEEDENQELEDDHLEGDDEEFDEDDEDDEVY